MDYAPIIATGISALASAIAGLVAWGLKGEVSAMRNEVRASLAEAENRFFQRVNGNYVRKELHTEMVARVDRIESRVDDLE